LGNNQNWVMTHIITSPSLQLMFPSFFHVVFFSFLLVFFFCFITYLDRSSSLDFLNFVVLWIFFDMFSYFCFFMEFLGFVIEFEN
jgi:hypothetical protein